MATMNEETKAAAEAILDVYDRVASGETRGSGGTFYGDGHCTLSHVSIPVDMLEALVKAHGWHVHGRTRDYRIGKRPQE